MKPGDLVKVRSIRSSTRIILHRDEDGCSVSNSTELMTYKDTAFVVAIDSRREIYHNVFVIVSNRFTGWITSNDIELIP